MTARETTLGALTAADLGKRVVNQWGSGIVTEVVHDSEASEVSYTAHDGFTRFIRRNPDTPVTIYDEEDES